MAIKRNILILLTLKRHTWLGSIWLCLSLLLISDVDLANSAERIASNTTTVQTSVIFTLETNPRLAELKQNRTAVQKDLAQTQGRYYPRVDVKIGVGTDQHSDALSRSEDRQNEWDNRNEASISLVQPLYQGGEVDATVQSQTSKVESADKRVLDNAEALALDAIIAHLESWRQRRLLELSDQNMAAHKEILNHIKERQRAGAGSSADVSQAYGRLTLTRTSQIQIGADLEAALANYHRVTGRFPGKLGLPREFRAYLPLNRDDALDRAENCNPKLAALAADIKTAQYEIDIRKSSFLPKVDLEVSSTYRDNVESATEYSHNNAAMVRARWNLFNGGSDVAARESAVARKKQTLLARKDQYNQIAEQVHDTWNRYAIATDQIKTYMEAVEYNRQTLEAYKQQFVVGQRSLLDVLDAENELFQSSGHLITARVNERVAAYRVLALTGCLLRSLGIDLTQYEISSVAAECCTPQEFVDSDGDGVQDMDDKCPDTPSGVSVDTTGCPIPKPTKNAEVTVIGTWRYKGIQFETNKWGLKPESYPILDEIVEGLIADPTMKIEIQGHSDSTGSYEYNVKLSQRRAESVMYYLIEKGIAAVRLTAQGFGPERPIAENHTWAGRKKNRRVELKLLDRFNTDLKQPQSHCNGYRIKHGFNIILRS